MTKELRVSLMARQEAEPRELEARVAGYRSDDERQKAWAAVIGTGVRKLAPIEQAISRTVYSVIGLVFLDIQAAVKRRDLARVLAEVERVLEEDAEWHVG